ncbi:Uncharacterized protein DAT39_014371, partial [Clarias magur]
MASAASRAPHYGKRCVIDELARRLNVSESSQTLRRWSSAVGVDCPVSSGVFWEDFP